MLVTVNRQFTDSRITWDIASEHICGRILIALRLEDSLSTLGQAEPFHGWDPDCISGKAACIISLLLIVDAV